jgi:bifunctional N-acetylglucosamine-1-phosphate-uridyltransferase/glucosamine-1-phosphate-acetyltransferase GlmU-like protein
MNIEDTARKLAEKIDCFAEDYDHYEYVDDVEDPEENVKEVTACLQSGETEGIKTWLEEIINEHANGSQEASDLMKEIESLETEQNPVLMQETKSIDINGINDVFTTKTRRKTR